MKKKLREKKINTSTINRHPPVGIFGRYIEKQRKLQELFKSPFRKDNE